MLDGPSPAVRGTSAASLPKRGVAGSTPVRRSLKFSNSLSLSRSPFAASPASEIWVDGASMFGRRSLSTSPPSHPSSRCAIPLRRDSRVGVAHELLNDRQRRALWRYRLAVVCRNWCHVSGVPRASPTACATGGAPSDTSEPRGLVRSPCDGNRVRATWSWSRRWKVGDSLSHSRSPSRKAETAPC